MSLLETKDIKARLDVKCLLNRIGEYSSEEVVEDPLETLEKPE